MDVGLSPTLRWYREEVGTGLFAGVELPISVGLFSGASEWTSTVFGVEPQVGMAFRHQRLVVQLLAGPRLSSSVLLKAPSGTASQSFPLSVGLMTGVAIGYGV